MEASILSDRERALMAVAEGVTRLPLTEETAADLAGAQQELGKAAFGAAEWVAITMNAFNRIAILSEYTVPERTN